MKNTRTQKRHWPFLALSRERYAHFHELGSRQLRSAEKQLRREMNMHLWRRRPSRPARDRAMAAAFQAGLCALMADELKESKTAKLAGDISLARYEELRQTAWQRAPYLMREGMDVEPLKEAA